MTEILSPRAGKGREIYEYLKKELLIPDNALRVQIIFAMGETIRAECEYRPTITTPD